MSEIRSCIYHCKLWHSRKKPKKNEFRVSMYMLYLDLDELEKLSKKIWIFGCNRWNILSFYDNDHFKFLGLKGDPVKISKEKVKYDKKKYMDKNTKERIRTMIDELKLGFDLGRVYIMTNVRNLGYIFNPVSFYFCYDKKGKFRVMFSEVNNTFHDQKMYYIPVDHNKKVHKSKQKKNYYISPFIDYDTDLYWEFTEPGKAFRINIDSVKDGEAILKTSTIGKRKKISNWSFIYLVLRYPMVTLMSIIRIHYQALKLWFKKVPLHKKAETDKKIVRSMR